MKSFEDKIFEKMDIDSVYKLALEKAKDQEIDIDEFVDLYGEENIKKDREYVEKMEKLFDEKSSYETREAQKLSLVFEMILHENAELSNWLGPDTTTIKSSRYDDILNGVDTIVEFNEEDSTSHLALAVDATYSVGIDEKFNRIIKEIDRGELAKIKYFISENMGIRGELNKVPRAVVAVNSKTVKNLADLWIEKGGKDELAVHQVQFQILEELKIQFEAFMKYAENVKQNEVANIYKTALNKIKSIYKEKTALIKDNYERDESFYTIENNSRMIL